MKQHKRLSVCMSKMKYKRDKNTIENKALRSKIRSLNMEICYLQDSQEEHCNVPLNNNGVFSEQMRICVIELLSLEVALDKIKVVSQHIFTTRFRGNMLPTHTTCANIADEAQYLVKLYTAEQIESAEHYGWNKDGTTKKKIKILENTITLATGQTFSIGYRKAARESST